MRYFLFSLGITNVFLALLIMSVIAWNYIKISPRSGLWLLPVVVFISGIYWGFFLATGIILIYIYRF